MCLGSLRILLCHYRIFTNATFCCSLILNLKYSSYAVCAGKCLGNGDDQVGKLHQLNEDLRHIIDDSDHFTLGQITHIYLNRSNVDQCYSGTVYHHISYRIHAGTDLTHMHLQTSQHINIFTETSLFLLFLMERTNDTHTCQVLSCDTKHLIQLILYFFIQWHSPHHDTEYNNGQDRNCHNEHQRALHINSKRHDHGTKYDNRRTQEQSEYHIHAVLYLIDVAGHTGDHGRCTGLINIGKIQPLNMIKQSLSQFGRKTNCRLCRKELCRHGRNKTYDSQCQKTKSHFTDITHVLVRDTTVNDVCHDQRNQQFKECFQQLEQRCKHGFFLIILKINH